MELSFKNLTKREVVNVTDGKSLGNVTDLTIDFPRGILTGISVPGKKPKFPMCLFSRSNMFVAVDKILKIGSDVILVDMRCGDTCSPSVNLRKKQPKPCPPFSPCSPCGNSDAKSVEELLDSNYDDE